MLSNGRDYVGANGNPAGGYGVSTNTHPALWFNSRVSSLPCGLLFSCEGVSTTTQQEQANRSRSSGCLKAITGGYSIVSTDAQQWLVSIAGINSSPQHTTRRRKGDACGRQPVSLRAARTGTGAAGVSFFRDLDEGGTGASPFFADLFHYGCQSDSGEPCGPAGPLPEDGGGQAHRGMGRGGRGGHGDRQAGGRARLRGAGRCRSYFTSCFFCPDSQATRL